MKKSNRPSAIGSLVKKDVGAGVDAPSDESVQKQVRRRWARCAGAAADLSFPLLFRSGRLVVYTRSPVWATELLHRQRGLLAELSDLGADRMVVRNTPAMLAAPRPAGRELRVSPTNQKNIALTAHRLRHPGLRAAVERLARRVATEEPEE